MIAPSPRPAAPCACGPDHPAPDCDIRTHREQGRRERDECDTTGGELRETLEYSLYQAIQEASWARGVAMLDSDVAAFRKALLALPALRGLLAERDTLAATVQAVEGLVTWFGGRVARSSVPIAELRRALGTPTTGGGE